MGNKPGWLDNAVASLTRVQFIISVSGATVIAHVQESFRIERPMRTDSYSESEIAQALTIYCISMTHCTKTDCISFYSPGNSDAT